VLLRCKTYVLLLVLVTGLARIAPASSLWFTVKLSGDSKIWFEGSAGPVGFACDAGSFVSDGRVQVGTDAPRTGNAPHGPVKLEVRVPVVKMDCGNAIMNRDLRNALRAAEFPLIIYRLETHNAKVPAAERLYAAPIDIQTTGRLTVSGSERLEAVAVTGQAQQNDTFRIKGSFVLDMLAYGIKPPSGPFGLVKVSRYLTVHFDVTASLQEAVSSPDS
jgi:hypothetical protein